MSTAVSEPITSHEAVSASAGASSWLGLVAVATLGLGVFSQLRAEVTASALGWGEIPLRVIVQAYAPDALDSGGLPAFGARPLASTQRVVDSRKLAEGVFVDLIQFASHQDAVLIAWLEPDGADLDFDALTARPAPNAWFGLAPLAGGARIVLRSAIQ